jgi:hypothetical protein
LEFGPPTNPNHVGTLCQNSAPSYPKGPPLIANSRRRSRRIGSRAASGIAVCLDRIEMLLAALLWTAPPRGARVPLLSLSRFGGAIFGGAIHANGRVSARAPRRCKSRAAPRPLAPSRSLAVQSQIARRTPASAAPPLRFRPARTSLKASFASDTARRSCA